MAGFDIGAAIVFGADGKGKWAYGPDVQAGIRLFWGVEPIETLINSSGVPEDVLRKAFAKHIKADEDAARARGGQSPSEQSKQVEAEANAADRPKKRGRKAKGQEVQ